MRISARQDDPGWSPDVRNVIVLLNGKKVEHCFTADEELGEVHVYKTDYAGNYVYNPYIDEIETVFLQGIVEIRRIKEGGQI